MLTISGTTIASALYESSNSLIYRGYRISSEQPTILKMLKDPYPPPERIAWFKREYEVTRSLNLPGVVKAFALETDRQRLVMVLEDFGGDSLALLKLAGKLGLEEFLKLAISITDILGQIHAANIIHKDINPGNIVLNPSTGEVKIIDFGISTVLSREQQNFRNPNVLEGTLAYISPEQTGRMNRAIDYRSDFYSLGVTFYELLTGQLPFESEDAIALVHSHIAKQPISPSLLGKIPQTVSEIVMKLMAKNAENRYQSAYGLIADLESCLHQLKTTGQIETFPLGRQDISEKFQIPQKLYGRSSQIETLLAAFERVSNGTSETILVAGYSGIGKSALVNEIHKPITRQKGYFISGKFDQFQRNIPYASLIQSFQELIKHILTENEAQIAYWQEKLQAALGANGQVIIDVIPEVELIIGKQKPVPELGSAESQNRFNLVFQNFINVFTKQEHPLVMFLDDLQWADSASLKLIKLLMTRSDSQYLLLIGAYRDNEVSAAHPLMLTLDEIKKTDAIVNYIYLAPLDLTDIIQLITDTLNCSTEKAKPLAELVRQKTNGNPFFMNQFLRSLYQEQLLEFDLTNRVWQWSLEKIQAAGITDNVVELMAGKIQKLSPPTQQVLKQAACIGNKFDLKTLAIVDEKSQVETATDIWEAVKEGLILPIGDNYKYLQIYDRAIADELTVAYKFLHDRVQQAAYSLIAEDYKKEVHLKIGQLLLKSTSSEELEDKIFDIVNQLNIGSELITQQSERDELARLNLIAGKKALTSAAYEAALGYLNAGIQILSKNSWKTQYELTSNLYIELSECEYLTRNFEQAEAIFDLLLFSNLKTNLEKANVYTKKILLYTNLGKAKEAIELGISALKLLGINLQLNPSKQAVRRVIQQTQEQLSQMTFEELINLPEMSDPEKKAAMNILLRLGGPAYFYFNLYSLMHCELINISIKHGNANATVRGYAVYGFILGSFGDYQSGYRFGKLSFALAEKFNNSELKGFSQFIQGYYLNHWVMPAKTSLDLFVDSYKCFVEAGNLPFASFASGFIASTMLFYESNLDFVYEESQKYLKFVERVKFADMINYIKIVQQMILSLKGLTSDRASLSDDKFDETGIREEKKIPGKIQLSKNLYCVVKLHLLYLFEDYDEAMNMAIESENILSAAKGLLVVAEHYFYYSLVLLALYDKADSKQAYWKVINRNKREMKIWAENCPGNFLQKHLLISAEMARVSGKHSKAADLYDRAIEAAKKHEDLQNEALGNELAAKFYLAKGKDKIAKVYLMEARYCYEKWGATAKVKDLDARYPELTFEQTAASSLSSGVVRTRITSSGNTSQLLDLGAVLKASQAIASEIILEKLLDKLILIVTENAGAQRGFLISEDAGKLTIKASFEQTENILTSVQVREPEEHLPISVINYVQRTLSNVVLSDATHTGIFTTDPYIETNKPKSVLCMPILHKGKLKSILYLENNLMTGAFTPERLEVLNLLSSQTAISIENANLYTQLEEYSRSLEQKVEQRTAELAEATRQAQAASQAKSTFLANMSHELRSPLNAILGFSQLMTRSKNLSREHQENLGIITRSGEHLLTLINNVLDLSKIEAGRTTLNEKNFDLYRLLDDLQDMFLLKADDKHLQLLFDRHPDLPQYVRTDEVKLRQVLINLLNNALKFTQEGGVSLRVRLGNQETISQELSFEVEDTGFGIAADELENIFEAFVQSKTGKETQEGTGLGLPISRQFVRLMGGEMTVSSSLGRGTTFKFNIKVSVVDASEIQTKKPTRRIIALEPNQPRYRILIVDDKWDNRQLLIKLLNPLGFEIREASNGQEAVEIWESFSPHLIWMDMRMPVMDGYEAAKRIKATTKGQATAIIALTASVLDSERAVVLSAGCDDFMGKPFREADIFETMNKYLGVRYVYEDEAPIEEEKIDSSLIFNPSSFQKLPAASIDNLKQALLSVDLDLIAAAIAQINSTDKALADVLKNRIDNFEYDLILNLIEKAGL